MKDIKKLKPSKSSRYDQGYIDPKSCKKIFESQKNKPIIYRSSYEKKVIMWLETNKNVERYLWISAVSFITFLLLGSFILSRNLLELAYLIILYAFLIVIKIVSSKE